MFEEDPEYSLVSVVTVSPPDTPDESFHLVQPLSVWGTTLYPVLNVNEILEVEFPQVLFIRKTV